MKEIVDVTHYVGVELNTGEITRVVIVREDGKNKLGFCGIPAKKNPTPVQKSTKLVRE